MNQRIDVCSGMILNEVVKDLSLGGPRQHPTKLDRAAIDKALRVRQSRSADPLSVQKEKAHFGFIET